MIVVQNCPKKVLLVESGALCSLALLLADLRIVLFTLCTADSAHAQSIILAIVYSIAQEKLCAVQLVACLLNHMHQAVQVCKAAHTVELCHIRQIM